MPPMRKYHIHLEVWAPDKQVVARFANGLRALLPAVFSRSNIDVQGNNFSKKVLVEETPDMEWGRKDWRPVGKEVKDQNADSRS